MSVIKMQMPCPFCGGHTIRWYYKKDVARYIVACQCAECKAIAPRVYDYEASNKSSIAPNTYNRAIEKWERRYYEE